jgi:DNA-binding LytR/AlgR family response regulator
VARSFPAKRPERPKTATENGRYVRLRDGRQEVEVDTRKLKAVRGEGNYVELMFSGGQRKLLRMTLGAAEAALAGAEFRRCHKSWLVRLDAVTEMERTGSGEFCAQIGDGQLVSISRRKREVIGELKSRFATEGGRKHRSLQ